MSVVLKLANAEKREPDLRSVPTLLRTIADNIDSGLYGIKAAKEVWGEEDTLVRGALVLRISGTDPVVFGLGDTTPAQSFEDFHIGAYTLMMMNNLERS